MQKTTFQPKEFGKVRNFFWPIYSFELKKLIPMFALFFLISFVYNLLRCMKISLIVTAEGSGAEVIPFLKTGAVLPGALLLTYIFTKLASKFSRERVFYTILIGFLTYFAIFLLILYPNHEQLQLITFASYLQSSVFKGEWAIGLIAVIRHLNLTVFYVMCELWSVVVLSMLFWGFANEVTKVDEAKRFYAIFALGANCSGIVSGQFAQWVKNLAYNSSLPYSSSNQWIFYQITLILAVGLVVIGLFYWLNRSVFHMENVESLQIPKKSNKFTLRECFSYLRQSKYLAYIVIIVVGYNIVYNLADVMWTYKVKQIYQNSRDVNAYMNQITAVTGIVSTVFAFIVSGNVIRCYGWTVAALITPIIWFITSLGFFSGLIFDKVLIGEIFATIVSNPANFILLLGSIQICFGRGCKYTVFDETKEIAFIPLPRNEQRKAKAVVDGLASRFGKSGGSLVYLVLFMLCGNITNTIPYVAGLILFTIGVWLYAVFGLGKKVNQSIMEIEHRQVQAPAATSTATTTATNTNSGPSSTTSTELEESLA